MGRRHESFIPAELHSDDQAGPRFLKSHGKPHVDDERVLSGKCYLTPLEATRVMGLIDSYTRTLELTEIEVRLLALEGRDA